MSVEQFISNYTVSILPALVVAAILGYIGAKMVPMVQKIAPPNFVKIFVITAWLHPVIAGALLGLLHWLPVPDFMGTSLGASIVWYALSGVVALPVYRKLMQRIEKKDDVSLPTP